MSTDNQRAIGGEVTVAGGDADRAADSADVPGGVHGFVAPGYEPVERAFVDNFRSKGDVGAALALYADGRKVVDLWGGLAEKRSRTPYTEDTLQLVFSSTKGVTALLTNLLAQRGDLDVDAPVAEYWPEFAVGGKADIPVRWLLCHKAGLPSIEAPLSLDQLLAWDPAVEALAAQEPVWPPGTEHGYHALTFGWLVGEVLRRATGRTVGELVRTELSEPLGLELWVGLPEDQVARVAPLTATGLKRGGSSTPGATPSSSGDGSGASGGGGSDLGSLIEQFLGSDSLLMKALDGAPGVFTQPGIFNRPEVLAAELPAANGVTSARSLAKLYAATIGPVEAEVGVGPRSAGVSHSWVERALLTNDQIAAATTSQTSGADKVLLVPTDFGLGYMRASAYSPYGGRRAFGHSGAGGSVGFADPEHGIGFSYTMNRMMHGLSGDPRVKGLVSAVYESLGIDPSFV